MKTRYYIPKSNKSFPFIFALVFLCIFITMPLHAEMLSIRGDNVNIRTGPGINFKIIWEYGSGFPVKVLEKKGDWLKTKDFEGDTGWIHKSLLTNQSQTIVKANRNTEEKINIRKEPSSKSKIIGMAYYGVVFKILKLQSGWIEVQHESGLKGWISSNLLWGF